MDIADDMVVFSDEEPAELEFHFVGKLQVQVKGSNPNKMDCWRWPGSRNHLTHVDLLSLFS